MVKVVPTPRVESTSIVPPCELIASSAIAKPWPDPRPTSFVVKKRSNIRSLTASVIPTPSSSIRICTVPPSLVRRNGDCALSRLLSPMAWAALRSTSPVGTGATQTKISGPGVGRGGSGGRPLLGVLHLAVFDLAVGVESEAAFRSGMNRATG